jgi:hypothetical protein
MLVAQQRAMPLSGSSDTMKTAFMQAISSAFVPALPFTMLCWESSIAAKHSDQDATRMDSFILPRKSLGSQKITTLCSVFLSTMRLDPVSKADRILPKLGPSLIQQKNMVWIRRGLKHGQRDSLDWGGRRICIDAPLIVVEDLDLDGHVPLANPDKLLSCIVLAGSTLHRCTADTCRQQGCTAGKICVTQAL